MKLTDNFSLNEFNSKDGAEMPAEVLENVLKLAVNLQTIRNEAGCAIHINSAYRSPAHNRAIGGAHKIVDGKRVETSQHVLGTAADLVSRNHTPLQLHSLIESLIERGKISQGGLGLYRSFCHYDIRSSGRARWDNS